MMPLQRERNLSERAYVAVLTAMLARKMARGQDCHSVVASYIIKNPRVDAYLVLVGDSFGDQMPLHCFLRAPSGQRLADSNRTCVLQGHSYHWFDVHERYVRGVILATIPLHELLSQRPKLRKLLGRRVSDAE